MTTQEMMEHKRYTFEVFCKTVLRNKARNIHKKIARIEQSEVLFADIPPVFEALLCCEDEYHLADRIAIKLDNKEFVVENETLAAALTLLLPKYKEILFLSYFMEYSDREIARVLGISPSTVTTQRASAIKRLREKMRSADES